MMEASLIGWVLMMVVALYLADMIILTSTATQQLSKRFKKIQVLKRLQESLIRPLAFEVLRHF